MSTRSWKPCKSCKARFTYITHQRDVAKGEAKGLQTELAHTKEVANLVLSTSLIKGLRREIEELQKVEALAWTLLAECETPDGVGIPPTTGTIAKLSDALNQLQATRVATAPIPFG